MTGSDDDREGFLGRWSKRKAEVRTRGETEPGPEEHPEPDAAATPAGDREGKPEEPAFDISTLPSLEDIKADTKLADFMRKEVPAALRNAALKRAWALDPAIRDYVNPAREYAYDWNVPGGVPGNGPIEAGFDALKEVARSLSTPPQDHTLGLGDATAQDARPSEIGDKLEGEPPSPVRISEVKKTEEPTEELKEIAPTADGAPERAEPAGEAAAPRRRHGGAAPA